MAASKTVRAGRGGSSAGAPGSRAANRPSTPEAPAAGPGLSEHRLLQLGQALREVAHQVRGPLGAIHLYARLLQQQAAQGGEPSQRTVGRLLSGVVSLSALLEDLLLFAETGGLARESCYLLDVLEEALRFAEPYLQEKGVRLTRLYAGELEPVEADPRLLASALLNLVLNGVEATGRGGELVVSLRRAPGREELQEVRLEDTGPGFSSAALAHLFEPFCSEKRGAGLGLGLTVAQRIVQAHRGRLEVGNRAQGGARVTVWIPTE